MDRPPPTDDAPEDVAALARYASDLADGIEAAIGPWVEREVAAVAGRWNPDLVGGLRADAAAAGRAAAREVAPLVRHLLTSDVDQQTTGPLALLRGAVRHPTAVLVNAGVPGAERDEFAVRAFPDDVYDLSPASFADLDPALHEPGLVWGAAKAHVILARRRREGRRG